MPYDKLVIACITCYALGALRSRAYHGITAFDNTVGFFACPAVFDPGLICKMCITLYKKR